jgi:phosphate acyltransferase
VRIALDAMGTDRHPAVEVQGAVEALRALPDGFTVVLIGDRARIEAELAKCGEVPGSRLEVVHATQRIEPGEAPATAVRRKPDSSIVLGLMQQREGKVDAFVSGGSTGAVMAASLLILRRLPGVDRPPIATVLPTATQPVVMLDGGANVDSKPFHLVQFAHLGAVYARDVLQRPSPRIGLLNIGEEPEKGNELAVETHRLLSQSGLDFIGNVEGRDVIRGTCDVLVTDGFVGNVLLKFYESVAGFVSELLKRELAAVRPELELQKVFQILDYTEYGGAPLLGVNGLSIICHGGSPPRAIKNAIRVAVQAVETNMLGHIRGEVASTSAAVEGA